MGDPRRPLAEAVGIAHEQTRGLVLLAAADASRHCDAQLFCSQRALLGRLLDRLGGPHDHEEPGPADAATYFATLRRLETCGDASVAAVATRCLRELAQGHPELRSPSTPALAVVTRLVPSGRDAALIELRVPRVELPRFERRPGQHVDIALQVDGVRVSRSYSLCSARAGATLRVGVRAQRPGFLSQRLQHLTAGERVEVSPPTGAMVWPPEPEPSQGRILLVAAGSGITPLMAIAEAVLRDHAELEVSLLVVERRADDLMLADQLRRLEAHHGGRLHVGAWWTARRGRPSVEELCDSLDQIAPGGFVKDFRHAYLCGPDSLMDHCITALTAAGYSGGLERESFGRRAAPPPSVAGQVEVILGGRAVIIGVREGESLLSAMLRQQIDHPYSCRTGTCHTCAVEVRCAKRIWSSAVLPGADGDQRRAGDAGAVVLSCQASLLPETSVPEGAR